MEDEPPKEEDTWQPQQHGQEEEEEQKDQPCSGEDGGASSDPRRHPARSQALGGGAKQADEALLVSSWLSWFLTSFLAHRSSAGKDRGQEEAESRTCSVAETAACQMKPGCLESELQALRSSTHPLALQFLQALERPIQIAAQLFAENQRLQQELQSHPGDQVTHLLAENQRLRQELQELKSSRKAQGPPKGTRYVPVLQSRVFPVQVLTTGHTGGCEKQFLNEVAQLLVNERVSLQAEDYNRNVEGFLLLFCPVVSRMGTDIENALEGLGWGNSLVMRHKWS
ncbi:uncharacterized protein LOC128324955 isoform X2 [Hemicordylus capensis]|uniref:uncharacterized protein LOC128324955 isoform X2 n=1 Tax=Hemicordylus capensis TaxID=884348 RepID=UPI002302DB43|nr:uncharacterized protein LOC128324955 isoform X2 [Hemicordylus capensis]